MMTELVLEDTFKPQSIGKNWMKLQLYHFRVVVVPLAGCGGNCDHPFDIDLEDVIGSAASTTRNDWKKVDGLCRYLHIFWYPRKKVRYNGEDFNKLENKSISIEIAMEDESAADSRLKTWVKCIQYYSKGLAPLPVDKICGYMPGAEKPVLFLVNPKSGKGRAEAIFRQRIVPLLEESGRRFELLLTSRPNHGRDMMASEDLSKWCAVVAVSGDGLLHEMINGLFEREDWATACQTPLGIIPGGSGNGLARSLAFDKKEIHSDEGILQGALGVIRGETKPLDLVCVETQDGPIYSCLSIGYALIADVDIESEFLRFLGEARFHIWSTWRIASLRLYRAKLSYLPAEGYENSEQMQSYKKQGSMLKRSRSLNTTDVVTKTEVTGRDRYFSVSDTNYDSAICESTVPTANSCKEYESDVDSDAHTFHSLKEWNQYTSKKESKVNMPDLGVPGLSEPVPATWKTIEDDFAILYAVSQSHVTRSVCISPSSSANDGVIWISMIRRGYFRNGKVSRNLLAQYFLKSETGAQAYLPGVEMIPVKSFRLQPANNRGLITLDGELIKTASIQATVLPSMANILS